MIDEEEAFLHTVFTPSLLDLRRETSCTQEFLHVIFGCDTYSLCLI